MGTSPVLGYVLHKRHLNFSCCASPHLAFYPHTVSVIGKRQARTEFVRVGRKESGLYSGEMILQFLSCVRKCPEIIQDMAADLEGLL